MKYIHSEMHDGVELKTLVQQRLRRKQRQLRFLNNNNKKLRQAIRQKDIDIYREKLALAIIRTRIQFGQSIPADPLSGYNPTSYHYYELYPR